MGVAVQLGLKYL